jgi:peptide/nickel transport system substrate-binding protein
MASGANRIVNIGSSFLASEIDRRTFIKRAAMVGALTPALAGLLAACDESDNDDTAPAAPDDDDEEDVEVEDPDDDEAVDEEASADDDGEDAEGSEDEPTDDEELVPDADTLVVVDGTEPDSLTPMEGTGPFQHPIKAMYQALVEHDEEIEIQPQLATDWEVSEDGLEWTFELREGVMFHNGVEFTSEDVAATIAHIQDEDVPASRRSSYLLIQEVDTSEPYVATFINDEVQPDFVPLMADGSAHIINAQHRDEVGYDYARDPIGTGPYQFVEWVAGDHIRMERFDDFWDDPPEIENYIFRPVAESSTRVVVMRTGEADFAFNIPPADAEDLDAEDGVSVLAEPGLTVHMIEPKVALGPMSDPRVRRALNMAVDKQALIDQVMRGYAEPLLTPGIPGLPETIEFEPIPYDPEQAQALLAEAGYEGGFELQDLIYTSGRWPGDDEVVEAVQGYLANIGVQMGIERRDHGGFVDALREDPEDPASEGMIIMPIRTSLFNDYHLFRMYHTEGTLGLTAQRSGYQNEEVDRLLEEQRVELDEERRMELLHEAQRLIWEDQPFIFLFQSNNIVAVRDGLDGYWLHASNHLVPKQISRS